MSNMNYKFSFTAAGALISETLIIAKYQYSCNDWCITKHDVLEQNLLFKDKKSTAIRQYAEIENRLKMLNEREFDILCTGSPDDVKSMIWLSIVKMYSFVMDFFIEIILKKYQEQRYSILDSDYYIFWESKRCVSNEISTLSDSSVKKIKQVVFKMLYDLGFIDSVRTRQIVKPILTEASEVAIAMDSPSWLRLFLYEQYEVKQIISKL